ncbi:MAG: hypothetical protein AAGU75_09320 [Bacillota bacterium]|jgi:hypothetical protein
MIRFTSDEFNKKVLSIILSENPTPEKRLTKEIIAVRIYGYYNPSVDRNIRDSIKELRDEGYPIISTSGKAGYYYDENSIDAIIADYTSRIAQMSKTINALRKGRKGKKMVQMDLLG